MTTACVHLLATFYWLSVRAKSRTKCTNSRANIYLSRFLLAMALGTPLGQRGLR